jgi:hypothetical protein
VLPAILGRIEDKSPFRLLLSIEQRKHNVPGTNIPALRCAGTLRQLFL